MKPESKVCNDFDLDQDQRIVILTGSNMAGKSTFLRTVGVNLALAYAGAPVNAVEYADVAVSTVHVHQGERFRAGRALVFLR